MKWVAMVFLAVLPVLGGAAHAGGSVHDPVATEQLEGLLTPLKSLSAAFTQVVMDADGYELQRVTGTMTVARPGRVHWRSDPPMDQLVVSDGETLWLYDRDLEQVTVRPFDNDVANTPAALFVGDSADLESDYRVANVTEGSRRIFTLVPRDASAIYESVSVAFDGETPVSMSLGDSLGQQTRIEFDDVRINGDVSANLFQFDIPPGVDVLREN